MSDSLPSFQTVQLKTAYIHSFSWINPRKPFAVTPSRKSSSLASMVKAAPNRRGQTSTEKPPPTGAEAVRQKFVSAWFRCYPVFIQHLFNICKCIKSVTKKSLLTSLQTSAFRTCQSTFRKTASFIEYELRSCTDGVNSATTSDFNISNKAQRTRTTAKNNLFL